MQSKDPNHLPEFLIWLIFLSVVSALAFVMESDIQRIESEVRQYCLEVETGSRADNLNKYNEWCEEQEK